MSKLEQLEKLLSEATPGPWRNFHNSVEADDRTVANIQDEAKSPNDGELICALRNSAPLLIEIAKAAKAYTETRDFDYGQDVWGNGHDLQEALQKLEGL